MEDGIGDAQHLFPVRAALPWVPANNSKAQTKNCLPRVSGSRVIPIHEYFTGFRKTALLADELITSVRLPTDWRTAWYKIGKRGSINISLVCCAIGLSPRGEVRIAFGCVAPTVMRAKLAEAIIQRDGLTDTTIEAAAQSAMKEVSPIDDHRSSASYRRAMCGVLTRRLLRQLRGEQS